MPNESRSEADYEIWNLIEERKSAHTADERQEVSKGIQKLLKQRRLHTREQRLRTMLKDGKGQKDLRRELSKPVLNKRVAAMKNTKGERCTARKDISEVFASFYERLYDATSFYKEPEVDT